VKKATGGAFFNDFDSSVDLTCLPFSQFFKIIHFSKKLFLRFTRTEQNQTKPNQTKPNQTKPIATTDQTIERIMSKNAQNLYDSAYNQKLIADFLLFFSRLQIFQKNFFFGQATFSNFSNLLVMLLSGYLLVKLSL
jgi:hypothetical protein